MQTTKSGPAVADATARRETREIQKCASLSSPVMRTTPRAGNMAPPVSKITTGRVGTMLTAPDVDYQPGP